MQRAARHKKKHDLAVDPHPAKPDFPEHLDPYIHMDCLPVPDVKITVAKIPRARRGK